MPDTIGSLTRRVAAAACLILALASTVRAQQETYVAAPPAPQFMARYDFHISVVALGSEDPRFKWDGHAGTSLDILDYVYGRTIVVADYQVLMGNEFRAFDPNQGNYLLSVGSSVRAAGVELVGTLHHISRHLSDRPKRLAIAWNDLDLSVLGRARLDDTTIDVKATGGKIVAKSLVDYSWVANLDITVRHPINRNASLFGRAYGDAFGIDPELSDRGTQTGGRVEAGIRLIGTSGAIELFGGYERVVDADPFDQLPYSWVFGGFRIVNK